VTFNFWSLDYIYYPVSGIMWVWHKVFGSFMGFDNPWTWVLSVIFLVFTLRAILFKPFLKQMDSQMKMQAIQPEMKRIREKYKDDRQRQTEELMKLNKEHGVSPLGSCLPMIMQIPVFISLYHVLRSFQGGVNNPNLYNYFFTPTDVQNFLAAKLFGHAPLSAYMNMSSASLTELGGTRGSVFAVGIPLAIIAGALTHLSSRRSVGRQKELNPEAATTGQAAIMNKVMLYVFPVGVVASAFLFPLPLVILFYYMANNGWTFGQLWYSHRRQDRQKAVELQIVEQAKIDASFSKPKPGAKPVISSKRPVVDPISKTSNPSTSNGGSGGSSTGSSGIDMNKSPGGSTNGNGKTTTASGSSTNGVSRPKPGARPAGSRPKSGKKPGRR
jgi:YidC/Oxa1 family membrane protein insertase